MQYLDAIKNYNTGAGSTEDLVALHAFGSMVKEHFEAMDIAQPDWLDSKLKQVKREIAQRNSDEIERKLRDARARLDNLKTPTERKAELQKEIARLQKMAAGE